MEKRTLDGIVYEYQTSSGRPIVFIHGWIASRHSWKPVAENLELDNPMLFYDQRCHGDSDCDHFNLDDLADDLEQLLSHLNIEQPVLAGQSMGGLLALKTAERLDASGVFLAGGFASKPRPNGKSPEFFLKQLGSMDRTRWAGQIIENYSPFGGKDEFIQMSKIELIKARTVALRCGLEIMVDVDIRDDIKNLGIPAFVVGGKKDGAIPVEQSQELAELLDCPVELLDATHLMLQEKPAEIADLLEAFVNSLPKAVKKKA